MHDPYSLRILGHLKHDRYVPADADRLMEDLGVVEEAERAVFAESLRAMADAGKIEIDPHKGLVRLPRMEKVITGSFRKNPKGFGFVKPDVATREGDVFIPPDQTADALSGDTVRVEIFKRRRPDGTEEMGGKIIQVLTRRRKCFSGELVQRSAANGRGQWMVYPDGREMTDPIIIRDPHSKNAKAGDKVIVEITAYPEGGMLAEGVIIDVLGEAGLPSVETQATIAAYNLPGEFPEQVVAQARRCAEQFEREIEQFNADPDPARRLREDARGEFILTIDPPDAKDYDDAIHIKRLPDGGWELGVHIADVAHFIPVGSPLDVEARARGNSVYLPRHVIPMLPEVLSNGICSLQEAVPRFCKSALMRYDRGGNVVRSGVASTLIKSVKRLTYLEAQALIDGDETEAKKHAKTDPVYTPELKAALLEMNACARAIRERRRAAGMIHLDLPEVELIFDENGRVVDAEREDDAFTHTLIEMFMVEANEAVARLFERLRVPLLRRIHPEPAPGDVDELRSTAKVAGFSIPAKPTRMELQRLLDSTRGTPAAPAVHFAVLRTLTKAEYSPALVGHYALASEAYAHFTSPIRRYPDLTVHRALAEYLRLTLNGANPPRDDAARQRLAEKMLEHPNCPPAEDLAVIGRHCTQTEVNASDAEDSLRLFLVLQLLSNHVGEDFRGMVTGCKNAGIFIQLEKFLAEGMIKKEDLPAFPNKDGRVAPGGWRLDPRTDAMVHAGSGRSFKTGDQVTVTIAAIDLALRRMDLVVANPESREKSKVRKGAAAGLSLGGGAGAGGMGGLGHAPRTDEDWQRVKFGQSGAVRRSQKSKSRDKGKNHRRDK
ncbi:MAG: VacB/RNase II family 3'-5' exoribonuclease [Phycisphaerae bacterium]|nr:VacB/RNase II family 3'-5' exoribonuclease [Phycisphaerae bacterium]